MLKGTISLTPSASAIQGMIRNNIKRRISLQQLNIESSLTLSLRKIVHLHLQYSPLISWIIQDWNLRGELGFTPALAAQILVELPYDISQTAKVKMKSGSRHIAGFRAYITNLYYKDLYAKAYATYTSYNRKNRKKARSFRIPWLKWLLERGNEEVVLGYDVDYIPGSPFSRSRTGLVMVESDGGWSVPNELSGTRNNNFITKAIKEKVSIIQGEFKSHIVSAMKMALR